MSNPETGNNQEYKTFCEKIKDIFLWEKLIEDTYSDDKYLISDENRKKYLDVIRIGDKNEFTGKDILKNKFGLIVNLPFSDKIDEYTERTRRNLIFWSIISLLFVNLYNTYLCQLEFNEFLGFKLDGSTKLSVSKHIHGIYLTLIVIIIYLIIHFIIQTEELRKQWHDCQLVRNLKLFINFISTNNNNPNQNRFTFDTYFSKNLLENTLISENKEYFYNYLKYCHSYEWAKSFRFFEYQLPLLIGFLAIFFIFFNLIHSNMIYDLLTSLLGFLKEIDVYKNVKDFLFSVLLLMVVFFGIVKISN